MHQHRGRLLLVDGEVPRAERLAHRLAHLGFDIRIVADGATALLEAHGVKPDAIVADSKAPILNGYRMLEALRDEPATSKIPVILMTDGSGQEELAKGWVAGADLCVPRSQGEADVLATLYRALSNVEPRVPVAGSLTLVS